jgi:hypothetical protein
VELGRGQGQAYGSTSPWLSVGTWRVDPIWHAGGREEGPTWRGTATTLWRLMTHGRTSRHWRAEVTEAPRRGVRGASSVRPSLSGGGQALRIGRIGVPRWAGLLSWPGGPTFVGRCTPGLREAAGLDNEGCSVRRVSRRRQTGLARRDLLLFACDEQRLWRDGWVGDSSGCAAIQQNLVASRFGIATVCGLASLAGATGREPALALLRSQVAGVRRLRGVTFAVRTQGGYHTRLGGARRCTTSPQVRGAARHGAAISRQVPCGAASGRFPARQPLH